jgi:synaptic vesicle membrane protein VAT-1
MRHVVVRRAGGYDRLELEERAAPRPARGEVLVRTAAVGVNYADCVVRMGLYASAKKYVGWPITPGFEFAGRVEGLGEGGSDLAEGDEVLGVTRFGGYATHVCVPRDQLFRLPGGMSMEEGAGFPSVFLTAYFALFELAHPRPGARVLVHSASGGVGGALVQLGKLSGCEVTAVVGSTHKVEHARGLGADAVIDKSREDLWARARALAPGGYHVVLDANGVETLSQSYRHLASPGKLVVYGFHSMLPRGSKAHDGRPSWPRLALDFLRTPRFSPLQMTGDNRSVLAFNLSYLFEEKAYLAEGMERLLGWLAEGKLRPPQVSALPLDRVADAHRSLESGQTTGKLVLLTGSTAG